MKTTKKIYGINLALTCSLTATKAQNIYVANFGNGTIGEYTAFRSTIDPSLITGLTSPALAISGNDLFVSNIGRAQGRVWIHQQQHDLRLNRQFLTGLLSWSEPRPRGIGQRPS